MQTRRKVLTRSATREHSCPRLTRQQRKTGVVPDRKAADLITSSARKQKSARIPPSKCSEEAAKNLCTSYVSSHEVTQGLCVAYSSAIDCVESDDRACQTTTETIFSPTFHLHKDGCDGISNKVDFISVFRTVDQASFHDLESSNANNHSAVDVKQKILENRTCFGEANRTDSVCDEEYKGLGNLSSEVSAIYLAMQHSKLESYDEPGHDTMVTDCYTEVDEDNEFDDFDPYLFIKNLPELSTVVPAFRPILLPKQTRSCPSTTLVLDLDETLVHSTLEPCQDADFTFPVNFNMKEHTVYVRCRPYLKDFLERVASLFEIIIFTASQSIYAEQLLNVLDPKRKLFRHRVYRESCVYVEGNYVKDLSVLGRDLSRMMIVDNSPQAFGFQVDNGIPIESWFDDRNDQELITLLPFLESLVGVEDVRPLIAKKFNLRDKIASATTFPLSYSWYEHSFKKSCI